MEYGNHEAHLGFVGCPFDNTSSLHTLDTGRCAVMHVVSCSVIKTQPMCAMCIHLVLESGQHRDHDKKDNDKHS